MSRRARRYSVGDEILTVSEIAKRAGLTKTGVQLRIERGVTGADLLAPKLAYQIVVNDERLSLAEIARRARVLPSSITQRLRRGVVGEALLKAASKTTAARYEVGHEALTVNEIAARAGITPQSVRYRLATGVTGSALAAAPSPAGGARFSRSRRGPAAKDEYQWEAEISVAAAAVAATWRGARGGVPFRGRLRWALTRHSSSLLRLFGKGARIARFGAALVAEGVTLDDCRPLNPPAVHNIWVVIERALLKRLTDRKDDAA